MECFGEHVGILLPDHFLASLVSELGIVHVIAPHLEGSLDIFAAVLGLGVPDGLKGTVLGSVESLSVLLSMSPHVKHLGKELLAHELMAEIRLLNFHLNRFECFLMPLLKGDTLTELTEALNCLDELLQRVMAFRVKFAVLEELIHGLLLSFLEHVLKKTESDLGDEELVVVAIMALHLGALTGDLIYAVVIGAVKLLEFVVKVISFSCQLFIDKSNVVDLSVISDSGTVQIRDLPLEFGDLFMSMILILFQLLCELELLLKIVLHFVRHVSPTLSIGLELTKLLDGIVSRHVRIVDGPLDVDIVVTLAVNVKLHFVVHLISIIFVMELRLHG